MLIRIFERLQLYFILWKITSTKDTVYIRWQLQFGAIISPQNYITGTLRNLHEMYCVLLSVYSKHKSLLITVVTGELNDINFEKNDIVEAIVEGFSA